MPPKPNEERRLEKKEKKMLEQINIYLPRMKLDSFFEHTGLSSNGSQKEIRSLNYETL